jgi:small-conductance mechanosensitive channel
MEWLENLGLNEGIYSGLVVIAIELVLLFVVYLLISGFLNFLQKRLSAVPALEKIADRLAMAITVIRMLLRLAFLLLFLAVLSVNGYQLYLGTDLKQYTIELIARIPPGFWVSLGVNVASVIALVIAARYAIRVIEKGLSVFETRAMQYRQLRSNDRSVARVFKRLHRMQRVIVWILVAYAAARIFSLPAVAIGYILIGLRVYLIISIGLLCVNAIAAVVDSLDGLSQRYAESTGLLSSYQQLRHLIPLFRRTLEYIVYASVATLVMTQLAFISHLAEYGPGVIQGIGIIFLSRVGIEVVNLFINRTYLNDELPTEERQRNETIFPIVKSILSGIVYFVAVVLVMRGLGFDPVPLLAGAGILGVVIGLGAQPLVNDIVSGFFIIFEDTFQVGDFIRVGEARGSVESIALRTTRVRSPDGELFILRNGELANVVNFSRSYTNAIVEVGVAQQSDLDLAYEVLDTVGNELKESNDDVLEATKIDGIKEFSALGATIRTRTKVKPGQHDPVAWLLRVRIKEAFDKAGIEMAFPARHSAPKPE